MIWIVFTNDFGIQLGIAPYKFTYLKQNWLTAFSLMIPALRTLRIVPVMQAFMQSIFVAQDAIDDEAELASTRSIQALIKNKNPL